MRFIESLGNSMFLRCIRKLQTDRPTMNPNRRMALKVNEIPRMEEATRYATVKHIPKKTR
jgi:hypothetical protein